MCWSLGADGRVPRRAQRCGRVLFWPTHASSYHHSSAVWPRPRAGGAREMAVPGPTHRRERCGICRAASHGQGCDPKGISAVSAAAHGHDLATRMRPQKKLLAGGRAKFASIKQIRTQPRTQRPAPLIPDQPLIARGSNSKDASKGHTNAKAVRASPSETQGRPPTTLRLPEKHRRGPARRHPRSGRSPTLSNPTRPRS